MGSSVGSVNGSRVEVKLDARLRVKERRLTSSEERLSTEALSGLRSRLARARAFAARLIVLRPRKGRFWRLRF